MLRPAAAFAERSRHAAIARLRPTALTLFSRYLREEGVTDEDVLLGWRPLRLDEPTVEH
jgi:hypothetical protein